jgi:hypothetical protein
MTKEQAIEALKEHKRQIDKKYINTRNSKAIETVLSMLEEKDKEIQFQNDINKTELDRHNKAEKNLKGIINKQNKIIDLYIDNIMTYQQVKTIRKMCCPSCPIGEKACTYSGIHRNCIKQYFENKAKELLNK